MRHRILRLWFLLVCVAVSARAYAATDIDSAITLVASDVEHKSARAKILCVLEFSAENVAMGTYLRDRITEKITLAGNVKVVTRNEMDKVDSELDYQLSGFVSDSTALSICERLGAQAIVFGQIEELDKGYILQVKMLDVETGSYLLFKTYSVSRSAKTEQLMGRAATVYKSSFALVGEVNKNSIDLVSPAVGVSFDYSVTRKFSAGVKVLVSYDAAEKQNSIFSVEPLLFARYYTVSPSGEPSAGMFIEVQGGPEILMVNSDVCLSPSAGISVGFRFAHGNLYAEPYLRGGYPYLFGAGIHAGVRF